MLHAEVCQQRRAKSPIRTQALWEMRAHNHAECRREWAMQWSCVRISKSPGGTVPSQATASLGRVSRTLHPLSMLTGWWTLRGLMSLGESCQTNVEVYQMYPETPQTEMSVWKQLMIVPLRTPEMSLGFLSHHSTILFLNCLPYPLLLWTYFPCLSSVTPSLHPQVLTSLLPYLFPSISKKKSV